MSRLLSMRVFERVATEGGFAAAARALDISAPVVTRLVAELEAHLGTRLFQRTTRRVSLTDAGEAYLGRVRQILQDIEEADALASSHTQELSGRLRLQTQPALATYIVAPALAGFRRQYPKITIDLEVGAYQESAIEDFDITLLGMDTGHDANIVARKVVDSTVILAAAPSYIKQHGLPQTPLDLSGHASLRLKRTGESPQVWRLWQEANPQEVIKIDIAPAIVANHTDTLLRAALDGVGIASISIDLAAPFLVRGELLRVLDPWISGQLTMYAALPSRKFIPQRSRVFLDYLIEHTRQQNIAVLKAAAYSPTTSDTPPAV